MTRTFFPNSTVCPSSQTRISRSSPPTARPPAPPPTDASQGTGSSKRLSTWNGRTQSPQAPISSWSSPQTTHLPTSISRTYSRSKTDSAAESPTASEHLKYYCRTLSHLNSLSRTASQKSPQLWECRTTSPVVIAAIFLQSLQRTEAHA